MVDFIPYVLFHKVHRNKLSSQVEICVQPHYGPDKTSKSSSSSGGDFDGYDGGLGGPPKQHDLYYNRPFKPVKDYPNWCDDYSPVYAFSNPRLRSRLEKLMGTNVVRITDRKYMLLLQERIREDHIENQKKRIEGREAEEVDREKKLILDGKIPIEDAPKELRDHPVCRITQITKKILEDKKTKNKPPNKTTAYKTSSKKISESEKKEDEDAAEQDDASEENVEEEESVVGVNDEGESAVAKGFMFSKEDYDKLKYEAPLVKQLKEVENVEEMYKLADEIVGPLKTGGFGK